MHLQKLHLSFILLIFLIFTSALSYGFTPPIETTDYQNRTVRLQKPAKRIIALAPHIVENLFSAGLGDSIVGAVEHSDFPEAAKRLPRVGSAAGVSLEKIIALKPDLVIYWHGGSDSKIMERISTLGIPVYADSPRRLKDISRSILDFATLGNTKESAQQQIAAFKQTLKQLKKPNQDLEPTNASRKAPPLQVFYQIGHQPLRTLNGQHYVSDVIRLCGGQNIFADAEQIAPVVSLEALMRRNPDVILIGTQDFKALTPAPRWLGIEHLWAVKHNQFHSINPDWLHRPTLRTAKAAQHVCQHLQLAKAKTDGAQGSAKLKQDIP